MTMVLDAFLGNFGSLLAKMAEDEVGMLLGIPGEIEKLGDTICSIQRVLSDAEMKQIDSSTIKQWLMELKDVMYDADDLMDLCQIKAEDRRTRHYHPSSSKFSCGIDLLSCFRNPIFAHEIGKKIKELNARLDEIAKKKSNLGLIELPGVVGPSNIRRENLDISRITDPIVVLADIVGDKIEEDTKLLVQWLTAEENGVRDNVSAFAIVGMPGIGKTTLAKKVFNDPRIQEEFDLKFWVCVSKNLKGVQLLKCIIREAGDKHIDAEERSELVLTLQRLIRGKKFFLVLDDVWHESRNVWDELLRGPMISGTRGSKLLVTTRDGNVALFMNATASHQIQMEKLSDQDAWSLLIKLVAIDQTESKMLSDIGLELVKKCDGLPLAVKAIAGVLRKRNNNKAEWQKVLRSNLWSVDDLPSDFHRAFYLSYEDLPSHLKQCFIFCSLFPRDFEIYSLDLIYLWLAEGFLCDQGDLSFLELGKEYCTDLILRNLLEIEESEYDQYFFCKIHDLLRSFAEDLGKCENFKMRRGELSHRPQSLIKLRRLSIEGTVVDSEFFSKEKSVRTLFLQNNYLVDFLPSKLLSFSHIRIIDLCVSNITSLPHFLCDLVHLRYLNACGTKLKSLPNSIGNLKKLVYLNLGDCEQLSYVPPSIVNLLDLRFLCLCRTQVEAFPAGLRKLTKLVDLHGLKPSKNKYLNRFSSLEDLEALSQLSKLELESLENVYDINVAKKANLKEKVHLKNLSFSYTRKQKCQVPISSEEKKIVEDVLNMLSPPPSLEFLSIEDYFGNQLPNWLHMCTSLAQLEFLSRLILRDCECFSQLPSLGQLPNLEFLTIDGATSVTKIGREFLMDDMEDNIINEVRQSSILPFSQLNELYFYNMSQWVEWWWEEVQPAMPKLKRLLIEACPKLSSIPKGLSHHAISLESLMIEDADYLKSIEDLQSVKSLFVVDNPNLERISNLTNLSFIRIENCPNLNILENLKPFHRMQLWDLEIETLPEYLMATMPEKLTIWCRKELLLKIKSQKSGDSEWQKFEHIPIVKFYSDNESLYAVYQKTPSSFITNVNQQNQNN
ncbi:Disease resistance protein (CC-NBS-LRR) [Rhynchospora pubera]|uniref:Disease resistance protein (CC-NBS-LRR) n=1 Tax=Rhynchospora pubera TaxID=906938 RepID=A0AAV8BUB2_9POAL|nr:Disease resistance protein (CC-NBS-LRR) [Rhynchospora pubera]